MTVPHTKVIYKTINSAVTDKRKTLETLNLTGKIKRGVTPFIFRRYPMYQ